MKITKRVLFHLEGEPGKALCGWIPRVGENWRLSKKAKGKKICKRCRTLYKGD